MSTDPLSSGVTVAGAMQRPVVGRFYEVPCIRVWTCADAKDGYGWVPVIGPLHADAEHLNFPYQHYHIDWRFVTAVAFKRSLNRPSKQVHGQVVTNTHGQHKIDGPLVMRRKRCAREMPEFQARPHSAPWGQLERAQAKACNKLKPGNICPHRGIDLTSFRRPDGTAVCPGHGLHWNLVTGELIPRHAPSATGEIK